MILDLDGKVRALLLFRGSYQGNRSDVAVYRESVVAASEYAEVAPGRFSCCQL